MDGWNSPGIVRRNGKPAAVVFVTAHDKHAIEAFELSALDYLLKPVRAERLAAALKKAAAAGRRGAKSSSARPARRANTCRSPSATVSCWCR